jgi:transcriptional regulator with XRE-family HTH domain
MIARLIEREAATDLPQWVYKFRMYLGYTQREFADLIGLTVSSIQKYEYGVTTPTGPTLRLFRQLAEQYGYDMPPDVSTRRGPVVRK